MSLLSGCGFWWVACIVCISTTASIAFDAKLDLVLMTQHQGGETKLLFRAVPQYFPLQNDKTRAAILFSDQNPYIGLNFTADENLYQQVVEKSVQIDGYEGRKINEITALKLVREQLFLGGNARNDSFKAIVFAQNSVRVNFDARDEVANLTSMNVSLYIVCYLSERPKRGIVKKVCGGYKMPADCVFDIRKYPTTENVAELYQLISQTIQLKIRDNSYVCGNGTGNLWIHDASKSSPRITTNSTHSISTPRMTDATSTQRVSNKCTSFKANAVLILMTVILIGYDF